MKILSKVLFIRTRHEYCLNLVPLEKLEHLKELSIHYSNVTVLESIGGLKKLQALHITHSKVSNLNVLKKMRNLQMLYLNNSDNFHLVLKLNNHQI